MIVPFGENIRAAHVACRLCIVTTFAASIAGVYDLLAPPLLFVLWTASRTTINVPTRRSR